MSLLANPLRTCRKCGLQAFTEEDLDKFVKRKTGLYGRGNMCKSCFNTSYRKHPAVLWLRKCRDCGLEAFTEQDLEKFKKRKARALYGRRNVCISCYNARYRKGGKYYPAKKLYDDDRSPKRILFKGKSITLRENPRTNICSDCGKSYPEDLKRQTGIHHDAYDDSDILKDTQERCNSCHAKHHGLGLRIGVKR